MDFKKEDVDVRVIDQRIGMGIGGFSTVIRCYHIPTGVLVEVPNSGRGQFYDLEVCYDMIEYAISKRV